MVTVVDGDFILVAVVHAVVVVTNVVGGGVVEVSVFFAVVFYKYDRILFFQIHRNPSHQRQRHVHSHLGPRNETQNLCVPNVRTNDEANQSDLNQ